MILSTLLYFQLAIIISPILTQTVYDVTEYGADNTAKTSMTAAVQKVIDTASSKGGAIIYFPPGEYLSSGPIKLRSHINVLFANKVFIKWSFDKNHYPAMVAETPAGKRKLGATPLFYSVGEKNITIRGKGVLNGQGSRWWHDIENKQRPHFMYFFDNVDIRLENFTLKNSPHMNVHLVQCDNITIKGITINNPYHSRNTDGINCNSCRNLYISGVDISTGDDCVVFNAGEGHTSQNILITDSHMLDGHSGVGIGSYLRGGLNNVTVTNCVFDGTDRGLYIKSRRGRGGIVENILYKNITMHLRKEGICLNMLYNGSHVESALHNRNIHRKPFGPETPVYRNIQYSGVRGDSAKNPIFFVGLPESPIADIRMDDVDIKSSKEIFLNNTMNVEINGKMQPDHIH